MKAMFVNRLSYSMRYPYLITHGYKKAETRSKDMLSKLVGERVAVVETYRGKKPVVVGYVTVTGKMFCPAKYFHDFDDIHCVPVGSAYDCHGKGKWLYFLKDAEPCEPYPLPASAIRHGRSWCEF